jgi:hypothetical protein
MLFIINIEAINDFVLGSQSQFLITSMKEHKVITTLDCFRTGNGNLVFKFLDKFI